MGWEVRKQNLCFSYTNSLSFAEKLELKWSQMLMRVPPQITLCLSNTDIYWSVLKCYFISECDPLQHQIDKFPCAFFALWKIMNCNLIFIFVKYTELFHIFLFLKLQGVLLISLNRAGRVWDKKAISSNPNLLCIIIISYPYNTNRFSKHGHLYYLIRHSTTLWDGKIRIILFYRKGHKGPENLVNTSKVIEQVRGDAGSRINVFSHL